MREAMLVLLVAAACGGSAPPAQTRPISNSTPKSEAPAVAPAAAVDPYSVEGAIAAMADFKTKMCACRDQPCAQHVSDEMVAWGQNASRHEKAMAKPTDEQMKKMEEITTDLTTCMTKVMTAASGSASSP